MKLFISLFIFSSLTFAADCTFSAKASDVKVGWKAYKTLAKAGVAGELRELGISKMRKAKSLKKLLVGTNFNIKGSSVNSGNPARDKKLASFFFGKMAGDIKGQVKSYKKGKVLLSLTMNGVTKEIPLVVGNSKSPFKASGHVDILDFNANSALASINEACSKKHEGKTWSDVAISLSFQYQKSCK